MRKRQIEANTCKKLRACAPKVLLTPNRPETGMQFTPWDNPMGTDGFEFVEYAAPDPIALGQLFETMGFTPIAKHRTKKVTLYRQGEVNFIINAEPNSFAQRFARQHGPSVCAMAFRVKDAKQAYERALELGAWGFDNHTGPMELNIPAIKGIGDSLIYFVDRWHGKDGAAAGAIGNISIYDVDFVPIADAPAAPKGHGLTYIDHLTHNVHRGRMKEWADFYERLFNFREVRYFDIEGKLTGLKSKAMTSPCGKIRIPINESSDDKSQIAEYLDLYHGEGIQHIAMGTDDIYDGGRHARARRAVPGHDRDLLRPREPAPAEPRREPRRAQAPAHPDRWRDAPGRTERVAAADLHADGDRPDLLRDHPAQGRSGFRRGQFPCVV
jgi:4-hydroxyphenylpyruvate dioxygenase